MYDSISSPSIFSVSVSGSVSSSGSKASVSSGGVMVSGSVSVVSFSYNEANDQPTALSENTTARTMQINLFFCFVVSIIILSFIGALPSPTVYLRF